MKWTVEYSTTDFPEETCKVPIEVPITTSKHVREAWCKQKFNYIFRQCFGNTLNYIIRNVYEGYHG